MDSSIMTRLLHAQLKVKKELEISVTGISMNPTLYENDRITVTPQNDYALGDILVFTYKGGELLVHRLLQKKNDRYFCKGDNSFRLEDISATQILGKVVKVNGSEIKPCSQRLIALSFLVNRAFFQCRYDAEKTKQTDVYKLYSKTILRKEENEMIYKKNEAMDYIQADETSMAVFDPDSGDTHFFDEVGIDILNILTEPCDMELLLTKLCQIYDVTAEDICADVEAFLAQAVSKKVIEAI